jgi:hypothetical protein
MPVLWGPNTSITSSIISKHNLALFSIDPPYPSVLLFEPSLKNWSIMYPLAPWIYIPSKPAFLAFSAPFLKSLMSYLISSVVASLGTTWGTGPFFVNVIPFTAIGDGARVYFPPKWSGCTVLPPCHIWRNNLPPFLWTALVTFFHPSTYASVWIWAQPGKPSPSGLIAVHSVN